MEDLKGNYNANRLRKTEIEKTLSSIYDMEVRDKLQDLKKFERLNDEKPTPLFLNLAKKSKPDSSIGDIRKDTGEEFLSNTERNKHIVNFYSSLYRNDPAVEGEIEDFLGPDISAHPLVTDSKLTPADRQELDAPLSIEELDLS